MANLKNPYPGINSHLNSLLQTPGTDDQPSIWHSFQVHLVGNISDCLNTTLPINYIAFCEPSLQIRCEHSIMQLQEIDPEDLMTAVVVRKLSGQATLGLPVLRIELLSPSNKPGGSHYTAYRSRRIEAIESNIPLVEIDYLHESVSPIVGLPRYPQHENSYPYYIAIHDNRPTWKEGFTTVYGFPVGRTIPKLILPLDDKNTIEFDFDAPYQHTYERGRWAQLIQLDKQPARFDTYNQVDRNTISTRIAAFIEKK
jgi:hypothetical protein